MKRLIILFILVAMALTLFAGCEAPRDPNVLTKVSLSQETKDAVDKAVLDQGCPGIAWDFEKVYYGTINNCIVVNSYKYGDMHINVFWQIMVGDYEFCWGHPIKLLVFKDGKALTLGDAYSKGWLNDDHLRQIYEYHKDFDDNFVEYLKAWLQSPPTVSDPNAFYSVLSEERKEEISNALLTQCNVVVDWTLSFRGEINDCSILTQVKSESMIESYMEIAGCTFELNHPFQIYIYRNGEACKLKEAYEKGWLTKEHIIEIHTKYCEYYE